jgi:hypothetical protein
MPEMNDELTMVVRIVALAGSCYAALWAWRMSIKRRKILMTLRRPTAPFPSFRYFVEGHRLEFEEYKLKETYLSLILTILCIVLGHVALRPW